LGTKDGTNHASTLKIKPGLVKNWNMHHCFICCLSHNHCLNKLHCYKQHLADICQRCNRRSQLETNKEHFLQCEWNTDPAIITAYTTKLSTITNPVNSSDMFLVDTIIQSIIIMIIIAH